MQRKTAEYLCHKYSIVVVFV